MAPWHGRTFTLDLDLDKGVGQLGEEQVPVKGYWYEGQPVICVWPSKPNNCGGVLTDGELLANRLTGWMQFCASSSCRRFAVDLKPAP